MTPDSDSSRASTPDTLAPLGVAFGVVTKQHPQFDVVDSPRRVAPTPLARQQQQRANSVESLTRIVTGRDNTVRRSSTSCGDEFAARSLQQQRGYQRDTGRRYYIRERHDNEDLLSNLLNLRDLLLSQSNNVHV